MSEQAGLGEFLRARRGRTRPQDLGIPVGAGRRRTPGLRREELATVAGVSVDYYTRLEQGKETNPSQAVLEALATAMRLDEEERGHLRALADRAARPRPRPSRGAPARSVRPALRQLLEALRPSPAFVLGLTNDLLASNPEGLRLLAGIDQWPQERRNTIRYIFLHPAARTLFVPWEHAARASVAQLRSVAIRDPDSPDLASLVGELTLSYETLAVSGEEGQRLCVYQATPGTPHHDALTLLALTEDRAERG